MTTMAMMMILIATASHESLYVSGAGVDTKGVKTVDGDDKADDHDNTDPKVTYTKKSSYSNSSGLVHTATNNFHLKETVKWSKRDVLVWMKMHLVENNIDHHIIKSFLTEFSKKHITGVTIEKFKSDKNAMKKLKMEFSKQNQAFGICLSVVETAIGSIDDQHININYEIKFDSPKDFANYTINRKHTSGELNVQAINILFKQNKMAHCM